MVEKKKPELAILHGAHSDPHLHVLPLVFGGSSCSGSLELLNLLSRGKKYLLSQILVVEVVKPTQSLFFAIGTPGRLHCPFGQRATISPFRGFHPKSGFHSWVWRGQGYAATIHTLSGCGPETAGDTTQPQSALFLHPVLLQTSNIEGQDAAYARASVQPENCLLQFVAIQVRAQSLIGIVAQCLKRPTMPLCPISQRAYDTGMVVAQGHVVAGSCFFFDKMTYFLCVGGMQTGSPFLRGAAVTTAPNSIE